MTSKLISDDMKRLRLERPFAREVAKEKNRFLRVANEAYLLYGDVPEDTVERHREAIRAIFTKRYRQVVKEFSDEMKRFKSVSNMMRKQSDDERIIGEIFNAYLATYGVFVASEVAGTSLSDFRAFALSAYNQEFTQQEIERMLRGQFAISAWRAATIARTEVGKVASFTQVETVKKASIETGATFKKKWIPFPGERTRASHAAMVDHPSIYMDAQFDVGGEKLDRPRDPNGSAGNIINCRCTMTFEEV